MTISKRFITCSNKFMTLRCFYPYHRFILRISLYRKANLILVRQLIKSLYMLLCTTILVIEFYEQFVPVNSFNPSLPFIFSFLCTMVMQKENFYTLCLPPPIEISSFPTGYEPNRLSPLVAFSFFHLESSG